MPDLDLTHRFTVPTPVETTWAHFNDIASVAECFPGATVSGVEGDTFSGSVKVKLGPIALVYNGSGTFVEKDESAHRFLVDAKGKDKRGNGTAGAKVTLTMDSTSDGGTDVEVVTDLAITGKPAQFGRGVMQDVSDKLLGQFVACLEKRLTADPEPVTDPEAEVAAAGPVPAGDEEDTPIARAASQAATSEATTGGEEPPVPAAPAPAATPIRPVAPAPASAGGDDALDLGAAVVPILLKTYWKQAAGAALVLVVLRWLLGRRG
ncbi:SRPBCC family protein [Nocardioides nanhaiensis]|uniref:SRPBCC family protein n=1 Tax=Nocardioides nanhaiensis TaxID=1476871 RepID=UPI0031E86241